MSHVSRARFRYATVWSLCAVVLSLPLVAVSIGCAPERQEQVTSGDRFETVDTPAEHDLLAPDGSQVRVLADTSRGSMIHCTLPPGETSRAVAHRSVEELWYCTAGRGEVWRRQGEREEVVAIAPGTSLSIPTGTIFQFRNTGELPLEIIIVTMPPWPGADEAVPHQGRW